MPNRQQSTANPTNQARPGTTRNRPNSQTRPFGSLGRSSMLLCKQEVAGSIPAGSMGGRAASWALCGSIAVVIAWSCCCSGRLQCLLVTQIFLVIALPAGDTSHHAGGNCLLPSPLMIPGLTSEMNV